MSRPYEVVKVGAPRSPEWFAARRAGIGSSEAAAVLGWGKWAHPLAVWLDKTGTPEEIADTPQMASGRAFEEVIARVWAEQNGQHIARPPTLLRSKRWPCLQASIDFAVVAGPRARVPLAPVEVKAVWNGWDDWRDGVPDYYVAQVIHQLIVLDVEVGYVAALINGEVKPFEVHADRELREDVASALNRWWLRHVLEGKRPPLEPTPDRALLARAVPNPHADAVDITGRDDIAALIRLRDEYGAVAAAAKRDREAISNRLAALMADHHELAWGDQVVAAFREERGTRVLRTYPKRLPASAGAPLLEEAS